MDNFRFLNWPVYIEAQNLSQIVRSALSISLNIAEGSGKSSPRELNRFLDIALGSAYETLAGLDALRRNKLIKEGEFEIGKGHLDSICKQIGGLRKATLSRVRSMA